MNLLGLSEQNILEIKNENKSTQDMNKKFNKLLVFVVYIEILKYIY